MPAVEINEISPGLNAFLDIDVLKVCAGVETNARTNTAADNKKLRPFLILSILEDGRALCVSLHSGPGDGRLLLDSQLKQGPGTGWTKRPSYFSRYQFWKLPLDCVVRASHRERSAVGNRQRYAVSDPQALTTIAAHWLDSDTSYRPISN